MEKSYYVYAYLRSKDSKNGPKGSPYYVGKGKDRRVYDRNHSITTPRDRRMILFLAKNMNETNAHQAEMLFIHLYGRLDLGTGCLYNLTDGGDGASGNIRSEETIRKQRESMRRKDINDKEISRLYFDERKSCVGVAKILGIDCGTIHDRLEKMGRPLRTLSEANRGKIPSEETKRRLREINLRKDIDDVEVYRLYFEEGKSTVEISRLFDACDWTIRDRIRKMGGKLRSPGESIRLKSTRKEAA